MDRFLMHVRVDYPAESAERDVMLLVRGEESETSDLPSSHSTNDGRVPQDVISLRGRKFM